MRTLIALGRVDVVLGGDALAVGFLDPMIDPPIQRSIRVGVAEWSTLPCEAYCASCGAKNQLASETMPS